MCQELIDELEMAISKIEIDVAYSKDREKEAREVPHKKARKAFLLNLQKKAEHKLKQLA